MTAVTEILDHCKKLISEGHQIDTQGLIHWIEDTLLEMELEQQKEYFRMGWNSNKHKTWNCEFYLIKHFNNETFKSE